MAITTWENLPKNPLDPTVISEAISDGIAAHEADPEAHLGAGESLETHRDNEVLDHPAESVVNDKVYQNARRYVAIVDPYNEDDFDTLASAIAYAAVRGGGDIYIRRGTHFISGITYLPPTISLQGDGIGETVVTTNGADSELQWYPYPNTQAEGALNATVFTNGSDEFTSSGIEYGFEYGVIGCGILLAGDSTPYIIIDDLGGGTYKLDRNCHNNFSSSQRAFYPAYQATNGSNTLQPWTGRNAQDDGLWPGTTLHLNMYAEDVLLDSVARDDQIYLNENYSGTTGWKLVIPEYVGNFRWYIDGITFDGTNDLVSLFHELEPASVTMTNCEFIGANTYVNLPGGDGGLSLYENCFFQQSGTTYSQDLYYTTMRNCVIEALANGSQFLTTTYGSRIEKCRFASAGYTNHPWIGVLEADSVVEGCSFESQGNVTWNNAGSTTNNAIKAITNSYFGMGSSQTITVSGGTYLFTNNQFNKASGAAVNFNSSSVRNVFANNRNVTAASNSGTANIIANNATG